ncbi:tyrosine-type recombinase/integrase [Nonomuraea salmonea]|uniref:tyrosine-type recombinase/integrase n=1 Tax=Nonomuraea salmonea TaxID=46181 RepID=UPI0031F17A8E
MRTSVLRAVGEGSESAGLVATWLNTIDSENTRINYGSDLRAFVEWLRDRHGVGMDDAPINLLAVNLDVASAYADAMRDMAGRYGKPLSAKTRARRLASLSAFYQHLCQRRKLIPHNFMIDVERPRYAKDGVTAAREHGELARMIEAAAECSLRDVVVVLLMYVSMLRVSEVCNARAENLGVQEGRLVLRAGVKGSKERHEPLDPAVADAVMLYLDGRTSGPLVLSDAGEPLRRHHVPPILKRVAKHAGVANPERLHAHVLRTSGITRLLTKGKPLHEVQRKVGHASPTTTEGYWRRVNGLATDAALSAELAAELPIAAAVEQVRARREDQEAG